MLNNTSFLKSVFNGIGQIMLQENSFTGFFFLLALCVANWQYGLALLLATTTATIFAFFLTEKKPAVESGLYGFSAALVGVALIVLFKSTFLTWLFIVLGALLAAFLQHFAMKRSISIFTLPFIVVTWLCFVILSKGFLVPSSDLHPLQLNLPVGQWMEIVLNGIGQVIFQGGLIGGALFLIGLVFSNLNSALLAVTSALMGGVIAIFMHFPIDDIKMGLFGFNVVLTAIALQPKVKSDWMWLVLGLGLTLLLHFYFYQSQLLSFLGGYFTLPFVLATMTMIFLKKRWYDKKN